MQLELDKQYNIGLIYWYHDNDTVSKRLSDEYWVCGYYAADCLRRLNEKIKHLEQVRDEMRTHLQLQQEQSNDE